MRLGVFGHREYQGLADVVGMLEREAPRLGIELLVEPDLKSVLPSARALTDASEVDAVVTLGGDGTFLRAARFMDGAPVPVLGVNLGRLGYLTGCSVREFPRVLQRLAKGTVVIEDRMALDATTGPPGGEPVARLRALNDVVLHKGGFARVLRMRLFVDGDEVGVLAGDGIVISTPTGSTAYSMSAGGPIVEPTVESILVTPIAAHTLSVRPLLLRPAAVITVQPEDPPGELLVTVDGQPGANVPPGHALTLRRAERPVRLVRNTSATFFARLRRKLGWGGLVERDD
ncbi:MAG: NAD(+)/NADH kinase [Gemmatimonadetes bacterium]|nr:NAD(+)/NADH kinase [Gemmatimonadota bacterium]